jgi:cytochrome c oxidase assembly factor CtaG
VESCFIRDLDDTSNFIFNQLIVIQRNRRLHVWVLGTLIQLVAELLAAAALGVEHLDLHLVDLLIVIEIVPRDMFAKLAAQSILFCFSAAPPKFARKL